MSETQPLTTSPTSPTTPAPSTPAADAKPRPFKSISADSRPVSFAGSLNGLNRSSMILYRLADPTSRSGNGLPAGANSSADGLLLPPPPIGGGLRDSVLSSSSRSSLISFGEADSKYPSLLPNLSSTAVNLNNVNRETMMIFKERGMVPYAYDPLEDDDDGDDPDEKFKPVGGMPWRGIFNVGLLILLLLGFLMLFVFYPVFHYYTDTRLREAIEGNGNTHVNGTGQAPVLFQLPDLIDPDTPESVKTRTGFNLEEFQLVFSDEFETEGRRFYPGDDPFWEAVDIWYGVTGDQEWYDPSQITTRNGSLVITMDSVGYSTRTTDGSTAPITPETNHNMNYRSGMLQSWNKFCFSGGYIEVAVVLPGANQGAQGYWPGVWTMGNLGRPGYAATTDGMWPYTYDSCDVGTFPNQSYPDGSGPAAALHSDWSRSRYDYELNWLTGQRLSACTCPNEDHPGPQVTNTTSGEMRYRGRGAPELDILEAEVDKHSDVEQHVVSQSAQFAPFTRDYVFFNATDDFYRIYDSSRTMVNTYKGSAVQQAVSGLTRVPSDGFQGSGRRFVSYGFEYESGDNGYVTWQVDGLPATRVSAQAMGPDPVDEITIPNTVDENGVSGLTGSGNGGSGVSQRLIPEEPMSIVFNLGISANWQDILPETLIFPAEMLIDYVRVYQKASEDPKVTCDPSDYPTKDYINAHMDQYTNPNLTTWGYTKPRNRLYDGC